jgi:hypothetical protein
MFILQILLAPRAANDRTMTSWMWKALRHFLDQPTSVARVSIPWIPTPLQAVPNESGLPHLAIFLASALAHRHILVTEMGSAA